MLSLLLNGADVPIWLTADLTYSLDIRLDDEVPLVATWSVYAGSSTVSGSTTTIPFTPHTAVTHYVHVSAVSRSGQIQEQVFLIQIAAVRTGSATVQIKWDQASFLPNEPIGADILITDNTLLQPRSVSWTLTRNGEPVVSGTTNRVDYVYTSYGLYRLNVAVVDAHGASITADSATTISGGFELFAAVTPVQPTGTPFFIGSLYSYRVKTPAITCTSLPFALASFTEELYLLPGTTHFTLSLDPTAQTADDEVVVRTNLGNWTLRGPPGGFTTQDYDYDYQHGQPYIPAPMDLRVRATIESINVSGLSAAAQDFRVVVKCYRAGPALYSYSRCPYSAFPGGEGGRDRRLIALFTKLDLITDTETDLNRHGSSAVELYTTPALTTLSARLDPFGTPDGGVPERKVSFTGANLATSYEPASDALPELDVEAVYGIPGQRPCVLNFVQYAEPRIVQKIKRAYGKILLYMANGSLNAGTTVSVRVQSGRSPGAFTTTIPILQSAYNSDSESYIKVGELDIDFQDFEFARMGLAFTFEVNENQVASGSIGSYPLPQIGSNVYLPVSSPTVLTDGACFTNPVAVTATTAVPVNGSFTTLSSCADIRCAPLGLYCYSAVTGTSLIEVAQPLHFPAPYVAFQFEQAACYTSPNLLRELTSNGTNAAIFAYSGSTNCGIGYRYTVCSGGTHGDLAVVYPTVSSPHSAVTYGTNAFSLVGSIVDLRPYEVTTSSNVSPITSCSDTTFTGSNSGGPSVTYLDAETLAPVNVRFPHTEIGIARWGVSPKVVDDGENGLIPGSREFAFFTSPVVTLMVARGTGTLEFVVSHKNYDKRLVVVRGGVSTYYRLNPGADTVQVPVQTGDIVKLDFYHLGLSLRRTTVGHASWRKIIALPRVYDTASLLTAGNTTIRAVGLCGLSNRSPYAFYGTLPADLSMAEPNPDTALTVSGTSTAEFTLVRARGLGEIAPVPPPCAWYAGQTLSGPLTFRFYASRQAQGAHGELDVWLTSDGTTYPNAFKVSEFKSLARKSNFYRRSAASGDVRREGMTVITTGTFKSPLVYAQADGERISVQSTASTVTYANRLYTSTGTHDTGVSAGALLSGSVT